MRYYRCVMRFAVVGLLSVCLLFGQGNIVIGNPFNGPGFIPALGRYLELTETQKQSIYDNILRHNSWVIQKRIRVAEVKREIAVETGRLTLDPNAIGVRYAEIEAICRDIKDHGAQLRSEHAKVLTDQQKARLAALEQVLSLVPVLIEAQSANMVGGTRYAVATTAPEVQPAMLFTLLFDYSVSADTSCEAAAAPQLILGSFAPSPRP